MTNVQARPGWPHKQPPLASAQRMALSSCSLLPACKPRCGDEQNVLPETRGNRASARRAHQAARAIVTPRLPRLRAEGHEALKAGSARLTPPLIPQSWGGMKWIGTFRTRGRGNDVEVAKLRRRPRSRSSQTRRDRTGCLPASAGSPVPTGSPLRAPPWIKDFQKASSGSLGIKMIMQSTPNVPSISSAAKWLMNFLHVNNSVLGRLGGQLGH